jgi:outer membrane protein assembly factor BamE (lipoprotein component of BamABCDE complex)
MSYRIVHCPQCGRPIAAQPGAESVPCPYCSVAFTAAATLPKATRGAQNQPNGWRIAAISAAAVAALCLLVVVVILATNQTPREPRDRIRDFQPFVGMTMEEVRDQLGQPDAVDLNRWRYGPFLNPHTGRTEYRLNLSFLDDRGYSPGPSSKSVGLEAWYGPKREGSPPPTAEQLEGARRALQESARHDQELFDQSTAALEKHLENLRKNTPPPLQPPGSLGQFSTKKEVDELDRALGQLEQTRPSRPMSKPSAVKQPGIQKGAAPAGIAPPVSVWRTLKKGMTQEEVRKLLGEPKRIEFGLPGTETTDWYYEVRAQGGQAVLARPSASFDRHGKLYYWNEP